MATPTPSIDEITQALQAYDAQKSYRIPAPTPPEIPSLEVITQKLQEHDQARATQGTIGADYAGPVSRFGRQARSDLSWLMGPTVDQGRQTVSRGPGLLPSMGEFAIKSPEIIGEAIPTPTPQDLQDFLSLSRGQEPGFAAKAGAGVFKANAKALGYVATLGPILGAVSQTSPLIGRMVEGAVGVDILTHVPDMKRNIEVSAEQGDVEGVARGLTEMGLGLWFGAKSTLNAGRRGAASESPLVNELLTKKIETDFTPAQVRQVIDRVQTGKGTPAEKEMVRFLEETGVPVESIQGGVVTERIPRFQSPGFNRYMGVRKSGRVSLSAVEPTNIGVKNAKQDRGPIEEQRQIGSRGEPESVAETVKSETTVPQGQGEVLAAAPQVDVPSPPPSVMAIAKRAGKDIIPMSGPDSKVHWFTFDGYQERADGSYTPQLTPVGPVPAPGLSQGSSYYLSKLRGYAPIQKLPTPMQWAQRQLPAPGEATQEPVVAESATTPVSFTTELGSVYEVRGVQTQRTKSQHPGHETKDVGLKPVSARTVYTTPDQAAEIGMHFSLSSEAKPLAWIQGDSIVLESGYGISPEGIAYGKLSKKKIPFTTTPEVGLSPVEFFSRGSVHAGNKIVSIQGSPTVAEKATVQTPVPAETPKLRSMEKQGDLLSNQTEDFALAGETVPTDDRPFSIVEPSGQTAQGTTVSAQGIPAIREMIRTSNLPANTKRVFDDFLSQPVMERPEFNDLVVAIRDKILIGGRTAGGVAEVDTKFIELSESDANSETLGHELAHFFFEMLPPEVQAKIDGWRIEEIKREHGEDASVLLLSGNMTSEQAAEMGLPISDYHLINPSEYLAHMMSTKFAEDSFAGRNDPEKQSLIDKIKAWLRELWNSIKRVFNVAPSKQQMYEDILAGKIVNTPRSGTAYEKRASFVRNPTEAKNAEELAQNAREKKIEGQHQVAQSADIVKVLEKHGASAIGPQSMAVLNYQDQVGIQVTGERMLGTTGDTYKTIKDELMGTTRTGNTTVTNSRLANPYALRYVARIAATKFNLFRRDLREAIEARDKLLPKVTSPAFLNMLMKEAAAKFRTDTADQNTLLMNAVLDSALKKAERALRYEDRSERAIDEIKGQIREMNEARNSSVALHQLVDDMVAVLASTPDGIQMLLDPKFGTRSDIVKMYRDLKISTGQTLHNPTLLKWGAYTLQRNKRLRENLVAAHMAKESPLRAAMTTFEKELTDLLKKSPAKAIKEIGRGTARMATEKERAKFAWRTLNKKVMERLNEFTVANDAAEVAEKVLADTDFKNLTTEINTDAGWIGEQKPFEVYADRTVLLPNGTEVDVSPSYWDGSKAIFDGNRARIETAITDLKAFLNDPANADDLNYGTHVRNLETLENYFTGLGLLQPNDTIKVFNATFGILHNVADKIGGRTGVVLRKSIRKYEEAHTISSNWMQKHSYHLTASRVAAMTSHGMKWGELGAVSLSEANQVYWDRVLNPLAYSHNRQQDGFRVGDMLPSGLRVTKEDMDHLRMMSSAGEELYKSMVKEGYVVDNLGGFDFFRLALKGTPMMTTRKPDTAKLGIAEQVSTALQTYRDAAPADHDAALEGIVDVLDNYWKVIGQSLVFDRNPDFAKATEYDGPGGALQVMANDARLYPNARAFFDEVANLSGNPIEEVTKTLALEWARPVASWFSFYKPDAQIVPRADEQTNAFTQSRNQAMAPYAFYENGFKTSSSLMQFGSGAQSRAMDELVKGHEVAIEDLQRQMREFEAKVQNLRASGAKSPEEAVRSSQSVARENGKNFDNYENLQARLKEATRMRDILANREPVDNDIVTGRLIGFVTGSLIGTFTTLRNVTDGPRYVGQVANRLMAANLASYPAAFWYGIVRSQLPFLGSAALTVAKSAAYTLPIKGPMVAIYRFLTQPRGGISKVVEDFMEPFMKELGENIYSRVKVYREMMDRGIVPRLNPAETELNARLMGSLLSGGQILDNPLTTLQKAPLALISLGELLFLQFSQKVNPKFGDAALNAGMYMLMRSALGPMRHHENRWKEIASRIRAGSRAWDSTNADNPINRMTYQEIFPRGIRIQSSESDLAFARDLFAKAGLDYDKVAFRVINEALSGGAAKLTVNEENGLFDATINMSNRAAAGNTPQFAKNRNFLSRWLSPFWNWATRMLSNFLNLLSVPVKTGKRINTESELKKARAWQWAYMMTGVLLPLLVFGALFGTFSNQELRAAKKVVFDQVMAYRQPWEREGGKSQAIGWGVEMLNNVPILGGVMSMAINDIPVRATMDPNFVMLEKIKDGAKYVGGVIQTGDLGYKLPEFVMGMIPDTRIILGRTEFFEGRQESNNAAALLRRYGPMDDMRAAMGKGGGQTANELSPYGDRMINAAMEGKTGELQQIYAEAVEVARKMGKANPERVVTEIFRSRNPYDRVFKRKITDQERQTILNAATPGERALLEEVERKFSSAASLLGASSNFTSEQASAARSSGGGGTAGMSAAAGAVFGIPRSRSRTGRSRLSSNRRGRTRGSLRTRRPGRLRRIRTRMPSVRSRRRRGSLRGLV